MVRLKADEPHGEPTVLTVFQFHYGSIKGVRISANYMTRRGFQFHYGSIKGTRQGT